tara:strand:- start:3301 stop:4554 length:1254 start_codon:yes stop_codon:yes gene_type:complete
MAERIRIGSTETAFPFIPSADKFLEYLGKPGGMAGLINALGKHLNHPLPDPKTVRKAVKEGVSPRSAAKITNMLEAVPSPELRDYINSSELAPWIETSLNNNGLAWLCLTKGASLQIFPSDSPDTFIERFVRRRAELEMELLRSGLELRESNISRSGCEEKWRDRVKGFLKANTLVDFCHIEKGLQAAGTIKASAGDARREQLGLLLGLYTRIRIDFYYQLLSNISLDLIRWYAEQGTLRSHEKQWLVDNSFFGDMLPVFDGERLTLPFERLLDTWRKGAGVNGQDLSWGQIAEHLPDPYGLDATESLARNQTVEERRERVRENKKSRLLEWRNGTRPKPEQLSEFVRNLTPREDDVPLTEMKLDIACIYGAFILDELGNFQKCGLINALNDTLPAFESYPTYWAKYRSQAAKILAA